MLRARIDVTAVLTGRPVANSKRRPLLDVREVPAFAPPRPSTRLSRAVSLADAAMIQSIGDSPRAIRRCATTVDRALEALDGMGERGRTITDAIEMILARCRMCGRCKLA